jgi:hypothetical protein
MYCLLHATRIGALQTLRTITNWASISARAVGTIPIQRLCAGAGSLVAWLQPENDMSARS